MFFLREIGIEELEIRKVIRFFWEYIVIFKGDF